ncbi:hypothetical protein S101468_00975 [Acetobacter pasteurianus subsp. pasteurianus]|uniref:Uncharacterized protein n=1 Tax=Acetobacter pasteurianus subsp. pasteurianus TaxID=481145 RepID=A0AAC9X0M5_ACEPA|nr:hypothetical protein S101468_00975 [Acetobacter pasteurianus subsp. pasteurianus]
MSGNDHTPKISNFFRRMAIDNGYIITPGQEYSLLFVGDHKLHELRKRLSERVDSLHSEDKKILLRLVSELSEFLSEESVRLLRSYAQKFLTSLLQDIRLPDVKTEVLMSWLAEIETSDSSSPKDGESVREVTTPSRTETVASDTQPVMQPCTHTRTDGEGV